MQVGSSTTTFDTNRVASNRSGFNMEWLAYITDELRKDISQ